MISLLKHERISIIANKSEHGVEISVSDTGIGVPPAEQPTIFEEFRQVGGDYVQKKEGTGLGLTLAKKFGAAWREDLGAERSCQGLNVYLHPAREADVPLS